MGSRAGTSRCVWARAPRPREWRSTMRSCHSATTPSYSFGGLGHRDGLAAGFYRLPGEAPTDQGRVVRQLYPFGFLPDIHTIIDDRSAVAGVRGNVDAWDVDFSVTQGSNAFHFFVENSNNA